MSLNALLGEMGVLGAAPNASPNASSGNGNGGVEESKVGSAGGSGSGARRQADEAARAAAAIKAVPAAERFKAAYYRDKFGIVPGAAGTQVGERYR